MINFLSWLFFAGLVAASLQDLKRREVDNWINLFLIVSGFGFLFFQAIFRWDYSILVFGCFSFWILLLLMNLLYYSRGFGGGDAKLLLAMFALFVGASFIATLANIFLFILLLMVSGSVWGICYGGFLVFKDFKKIKNEVKKWTKNIYFKYAIFAGIILFVLSYIDWMFLFVSIFVLVGAVLVVFAKSIEKIVMIKDVEVKDLREGDWLVDDVQIKGKTIKADWEGLSEQDLKLLKNSKRKIKIKEGLPFVPGFLIAFLIYVFARGWLVDFFVRLV